MLSKPRMMAKGHRIYTSCVKIWGDDVSGNQSKQYNEHTNVYFADIESWHEAFDCQLREEILFRILPIMMPADNPQQSQSCSHRGLNSNYWCRKCKLGGTVQERETDECFHQHFPPSRPRHASETLEIMQCQIQLSALGVAKVVTDLQTASGVSDKLADHWIEILLAQAHAEQQVRIYNAATPRRHELRAGEHYNSLLQLPQQVYSDIVSLDGDIHSDTSVEILHTYLLGIDKYIWHFTNTAWSAKQCDTFATRLQSSSVDGLSIPPIRASYIVKYRNGLIGKHFKTLQQVAIFHLDESLCSDPRVIDVWKATGELGAYLWFHEIQDMDVYLKDVEILVANMLDVWSTIDLRRIFVKPKIHILSHIIEDIRRHGPPGLYATEIFECFNTIFRLCSVLSNHQAPSRDIATTLAGLARFKYQVSGAWWRDSKGNYVHAGSRIQQYFKDPSLQRRLGYVQRQEPITGAVMVRRKETKASATWRSFNVKLSREQEVATIPDDSRWHRAVSVVSQHGDCCKEGLWVFADHARSLTIHGFISKGHTIIGRIAMILKAAERGAHARSVVIIEPFTMPATRHHHFGMPELLKTADGACVVVKNTDVLFLINMQHNCWNSKCAATAQRPRVQERLETELSETFIEHVDDKMHLLNMHALHNAALIRRVLPRSLTAPIPQDAHRAKDAQARKERAATKAAQQAVGRNAVPGSIGEAEMAPMATMVAGQEVAGPMGSTPQGIQTQDIDG
ncbi:hypothetical protein OBBRIDRAFT_815707 [Obba rivulosa]|uniref:Transposase n=1 Tax=Obba rivulosa TaxID=1052685 RepID=A0A8E2AFZ5_9APHY|nr:hypothetical protein OBBRIDRAFT_815707 [Obba rivulosa]